MATAEGVTDGALADSSALCSESGSAYPVLKVAMKEYCLAREAAFHALEDLYKLKTSFAMSEQMSVVLRILSTTLAVSGVRPVPLTMCSQKATFGALRVSPAVRWRLERTDTLFALASCFSIEIRALCADEDSNRRRG